MKQGCVYIIRAKGTNLYKIGITDRAIGDRLKELQTGSPQKLELVDSLSTENCAHIERYLHQKWDAHRQRGEWFEFKDIEPVLTPLRLANTEKIGRFGAARIRHMFDLLPNGFTVHSYMQLLDTKARFEFINHVLCLIFDRLWDLENRVEPEMIFMQTSEQDEEDDW
jgi:hypothetical protein